MEEHKRAISWSDDEATPKTRGEQIRGRTTPDTPGRRRPACGCDWTNQAKILAAITCLFAGMTVSQFFFALYANSEALLVDCGSMAVDTLAYGGNLWAACNEDDSRAERARVSLLTSGASILVLYVITGWGMVEAVEEIIEKHPDDDLRPGIVLIFGVLGLVVDFAALAAFKIWGDDGDPHGHGALDEDVADIVGDAAVLPPVSYDRVEGAASTDDDDSDGGDADPLDAIARSADAMNMCAAFSHVAADTVRSVTSIALGLLTTLDDDVNGASWDAYATLVVTATVLFGSTALAADWCRLAMDLVKARRAGGNYHRTPVKSPKGDEAECKETEMLVGLV